MALREAIKKLILKDSYTLLDFVKGRVLPCDPLKSLVIKIQSTSFFSNVRIPGIRIKPFQDLLMPI